MRAEARAAVLGEGELVIGRSAYCSLVLEHNTVSRLHAVLRSVDDAVELSDMGSSNGTFVNGTRITGPVRVKLGDDIKIGTQPLSLEPVPPRKATDTGRISYVDDSDTLNKQHTKKDT